MSETTDLLLAGLGGLAGILSGSGDTQGSQGYTGGIPEYTANREQVPGAFDPTNRRPGEAGRQYFTDVQYTPKTDAEGNQTVMGGDYLAQLNADALARQQQRRSDYESLLEMLMNNQTTSQGPTTPPPQPPTTPPPQPPTTPPPQPPTTTGITDAQIRAAIGTVQAGTGTNQEKYARVVKAMKNYNISPERVAEVMGIPLANVQRVYDKYESNYARGGLASLPQSRGYYLGGPTDGMADKVPATIDGREPARLSDGEFVIPADVVSHLGNGNSDAGANQLYSMMDKVRKARTGNTRQGKQINPNKYLMG